jgi:hypothetical protein
MVLRRMIWGSRTRQMIKKTKVLEADEEYRDFERQMKKIKKADSVY